MATQLIFDPRLSGAVSALTGVLTTTDLVYAYSKLLKQPEV